MGRKQQQNRTSLKKASAERTATLLSAGGGLPQLYAFFPSLNLATSNDTEAESTVDSEFRLLLKKFFKKDAVTKLKALEEFTSLVGTKSEDSLLAIVPFWPRHFGRLGMDIDRRVRENTFIAHRHLCLKLGKSIAPYLKTLLAPWLIGRFDVHGPAASEAEKSFNAVFPEYKHRNVFTLYLADLIAHFRRNLLDMTAATVPDCQDLTDEEKAIKLVSIQCGTLQALRFVLEILMVDPPMEQKKMEPCINLMNDPQLLEIKRYESASSQRFFYELLNTSIEKNVIRDVGTLAKLTLGRLAGSQDPSTCSAIWHTSIQLVVTHPNCWTLVDMDKVVLPQLKLVIKRRGSGSAQSIFQALLPFFAKMPKDNKYRVEILTALQNCMTENVTTQTSVSDLGAVAKAFFECLRYTIVHFTESSTEIFEVVQKRLLPLLRKLLETNDVVISRVLPLVSKETHSLVCYLQKSSAENEKYLVFGSIYDELYKLMREELQIGQSNAVAVFHSHLNRPEAELKTKKTLSFACDSEPKQNKAKDSFAINEGLVDLNRLLLCHVLNLCLVRCDSGISKLIGSLFPTHYNSISKEYFENEGFDKTKLLEVMDKCLAEQSTVGTGMEIMFTLANMQPSLGEGVQEVLGLCERNSQLLMTILDQASNFITRNTLRPIISELFHTEAFANAISSNLEGPHKLNIAASCLSSPDSFPDGLLEKLLISLIDDFEVILVKDECVLRKKKLCEIISSISAGSTVWSKSLFSTLVFRIYQLSIQHLHEGEKVTLDTEAIAKKLRLTWLSSIKKNCEQSRECCSKIVVDLKQKMMDLSSADSAAMIECILSLVEDKVHSTTLEQFLPTPTEFDEMCTECRISDWLASDRLRQKDYALLILDGEGDFIQEPTFGNFVAGMKALYEICESKGATELFDVAQLMLINLLEPQAKLKNVINSRLSDEKIVENTVNTLRTKEGFHWMIVLDNILNITKYRVSDVSSPPDNCLLQQICIKHNSEEKQLVSCLNDTITEMTATFGNMQPAHICTALRCIQNLPDELTCEPVVRLFVIMKSTFANRPELLDTSRATGLHLATCCAFSTIHDKQRSIMSRDNLEFIWNVIAKMIAKFPWHSMQSQSRLTLALGITLCDLAVQTSDTFHSEESYSIVEKDIMQRFLKTVIKSLVPERAADFSKLNRMPELLLESVADVYVSIDPTLLSEHWTSQAEDAVSTLRDIMASLCASMQMKVLPVQLSAYALASSAMSELAKMREDGLVDDSSINEQMKIDPLLYGFLQDMSSAVAILKKTQGGYLQTERLNNKELCVVSAYILAMSTVLHFCGHLNSEERSAYIEYVQEQGHWETYLNLLFEFIPEQMPSTVSFGSALPSKFDFVHLACWALFEVSAEAPGVVKSWFTKLNDHRSENRVRNLMAKYISPILISKELSLAQSGELKEDKLSLTTISTSREIIARYSLEDIGRTCEVSVQMDACHPLKPMRITYDQDNVAGSKSTWQQWIRQLYTFLHASNGSVVEGLKAWKENFDRKLEGGVECCICYSVLHASTLKLPNYPCLTCKNRFHKACMYKWFRQGHATCPLCRSTLG